MVQRVDLSEGGEVQVIKHTTTCIIQPLFRLVEQRPLILMNFDYEGHGDIDINIKNYINVVG